MVRDVDGDKMPALFPRDPGAPPKIRFGWVNSSFHCREVNVTKPKTSAFLGPFTKSPHY